MKRALFLLLFCVTAHADLSTNLLDWMPPRFYAAGATPVLVTTWLPWNFIGFYDKGRGRIFVLSGFSDFTLAHEAGHAVWHHDLSRRRQAQWRLIHKTHPCMTAVVVYPDDPQHSFAEAFAGYVVQPMRMFQDEPDVYLWFRDVSGTEFLGRQP